MATVQTSIHSVIVEYRDFIRHTLSLLRVPTCDLPDVEQEVYCAIDRGLSTFDPLLARDPATALRAWIFGICRRQAASKRRLSLRRAEVFFANDEFDLKPEKTEPHAEHLLIAARRRAMLNRLLEKLEPLRRAVVIAHEIEGMRMVEIAALMEIKLNTAWNRLRLGLADLRAAGRRLARKEK